MKSQYAQKFKEANEKLESGDVSTFGKEIINLHSVMMCDCFFGRQKDGVYEKQLQLVLGNSRDESDFYTLFAMGFLYLRTNDEANAFAYLSKAINANSTCDVSYSVRSGISERINRAMVQDAEKSVFINPSARNYLKLAKSLAKSCNYKEWRKPPRIERSIHAFDKAVELGANLVCAFNGRARELKKKYYSVHGVISDLQGAVNDYVKSIEINKSQNLYHDLASCLKDLKRYDEALKYAELGFNMYPNDTRYLSLLGYSFAQVGNYKKAVLYYHNYFDLYSARKERCGDTWRAENVPAIFHAALSVEDIEMYFDSLLKFKSLSTLDSERSSLSERLRGSYPYHYYGPLSKVNFGKYKGKTIMEILDTEPDYISWCIISIDKFSVCDRAFLSKQLRSSTKFLTALEFNLMKALITIQYEGGQEEDDNYNQGDYIREVNGDWGGLYGEEAETGYWNTE
jgi:tetratricopeptide (TPR) repeat protein